MTSTPKRQWYATASKHRQAVINLAAILDAAEASMTNLVETTFYADVEDLSTINTVYSRRMPDLPRPFRDSLGISIDTMAIKTNA